MRQRHALVNSLLLHDGPVPPVRGRARAVLLSAACSARADVECSAYALKQADVPTAALKLIERLPER